MYFKRCRFKLFIHKIKNFTIGVYLHFTTKVLQSTEKGCLPVLMTKIKWSTYKVPLTLLFVVINCCRYLIGKKKTKMCFKLRVCISNRTYRKTIIIYYIITIMCYNIHTNYNHLVFDSTDTKVVYGHWTAMALN